MPNFSDKETQQYYDSYSDVYAVIWNEQMHTGYFNEPKELSQAVTDMNAYLAEEAGMRQGATIVSVGCGRGGADRFFARELGATVIGIDISERQIEEATKRAVAENLGKQITYHVGSMTELPVADGAAGVVWVQEALFHCHDKDAAVREFLRVLKPGGIVVVEDTVLLDPAALAEVMAAFGARVYINNIFSPDDYRALFRKVGFSVKKSLDLTSHLAETYRVIAAYIAEHRDVLKTKIPEQYWPTLENDTNRARTLRLVEEKKLGCAALVFEKSI